VHQAVVIIKWNLNIYLKIIQIILTFLCQKIIMKKHLIIGFLLFYLIIPAMNATDLAKFLPKQANGWSAIDTDNYYNKSTLFSYIDGAAELYISYGFQTVMSSHYTCPNEPDIVADIFDMNEPRNAFGVFTNMREKDQHQFGQGSQLIEGSLIFWKDHYFVSVTVDKFTGKSKLAVDEIAGFIDHAIVKEGDLPEVMQYLPLEERVADGYCYFHHYIWLNSLVQIANINIFNIDETTNAVVSKYGSPEKRMVLLVIQYPDQEASLKAYNQYVEQLYPGLKNNDAIGLKNNTWHAAFRQGKFIVAVFNAPGKNEAIGLLNSCKAMIALKEK
jgi:hypothetical protein